VRTHRSLDQRWCQWQIPGWSRRRHPWPLIHWRGHEAGRSRRRWEFDDCTDRAACCRSGCSFEQIGGHRHGLCQCCPGGLQVPEEYGVRANKFLIPA